LLLQVDPHVLRWIAVAQPSKARLNQEEVMSQLMAAEQQGNTTAGAASQDINSAASSSGAGNTISQEAPSIAPSSS
jgi:hypothetical protein